MYIVDGLQQPTCDEGVRQLDFECLEKCLEISTALGIEDDLAPALVLLELSLICSDTMKASAAEFFNKLADFVAAVSARRCSMSAATMLEMLLRPRGAAECTPSRLGGASSPVVQPLEEVFEALDFLRRASALKKGQTKAKWLFGACSWPRKQGHGQMSIN
jgi:hypothetical protein